MDIELLSNVGINDVSLVGGKNASLGEMIKNLSKKGIRVPDGFVITTTGYKKFLTFNKLETRITELMNGMDTSDLVSLRRTGMEIRTLIQNADYPEDLENNIVNNYAKLSSQYKDSKGYVQKATDVAVRSSSTAEDLAEASFAGQQETYLNVRGKYQVLESIKNCFASLYTDRAISYRKSIGYKGELSISVCVQKMVRSDLGCAGVAFSLDTESGFKDLVVVNGSWGLGELVVGGGVKPDEFIMYKPKLKEGFKAIIDKKMGHKNQMIVYGTNPDEKTKLIPTTTEQFNRFCLKDNDILLLGKWVCEIEDYYTQIYGKFHPIDTEWAYDGLSKELFIVQARPETVHSNKETNHKIIEYHLSECEKTTLVSGVAVGDKIGCGKVKIVHTLDNRNLQSDHLDFSPGDILVTDMTDPDWEPIMRIAGAIITNRGGRTCHASIVAREIGVPAVVGTINATEILESGNIVTVCCSLGDIGYVFNGAVPYKEVIMDTTKLPKIKTNIMFNLASPNDVFRYHNYPVKGVGLVREEFIINNFIKVHPLALLNYGKLEYKYQTQIDDLIVGYKSPTEYYIEKLVFGLGRIASTFYPNDVIVRFSDFKSNEYRNLLGGELYEPEEENPMIGWRGASRYYDEKFEQAFGLECLAIKHLRNTIGLDNIIVMIPFCRTVEECKQVLETMKKYGLVRGENGLKVYIMCEIPSNVIMADEFCKYVDGFSIGSNDLTQLALGLDRDSGLVAHIYNERNPAVKKLIHKAIKTCKKNGVKIGICGQAPSDYPDFAQFLVEEGIDTISITPDALIKTVNAINTVEQLLNKNNLQ